MQHPHVGVLFQDDQKEYFNTHTSSTACIASNHASNATAIFLDRTKTVTCAYPDCPHGRKIDPGDKMFTRPPVSTTMKPRDSAAFKGWNSRLMARGAADAASRPTYHLTCMPILFHDTLAKVVLKFLLRFLFLLFFPQFPSLSYVVMKSPASGFRCQ